MKDSCSIKIEIPGIAQKSSVSMQGLSTTNMTTSVDLNPLHVNKFC